LSNAEGEVTKVLEGDVYLIKSDVVDKDDKTTREYLTFRSHYERAKI